MEQVGGSGELYLWSGRSWQGHPMERSVFVLLLLLLLLLLQSLGEACTAV